MKIEFKKRIGQQDFTFHLEVDSPVEFFKQVDFYSRLPEKGPNGETDLFIQHRHVVEGSFDYFSIVCPSAGKEFQFGMLKNPKGHLFPKGWQPIFGNQNSSSSSASEGVKATVDDGLDDTPAPQPAKVAAEGETKKPQANVPDSLKQFLAAQQNQQAA